MPKPQIILITGATTGIGKCAALHFAKLGHTVIATGRNESALERLKEAGRDWKLHTLHLDVNDQDSIARAAREVEDLTRGYGLDVLINNAGIALAGAIEDTSDKDLRAQFETNVFGLLAVIRAFLPKMRMRGSGRILNVSSSGGRISLPLVGAYHGAKFALEAISDALRWEVSPFGVQVVLIEPGPVRSEFGSRLVESVAHLPKDSPYAPIYAEVKQIQAFSEAQMLSPDAVVRAMEHAITAKRPRARYLMPKYFGLGIFLYQMIPTFISDWLICRLTGLTRKKLL